MGVFTKAITGGKHLQASNVENLGHSIGYNLMQEVFYKGAGLGDDYENVYEYVRPIAERFARILPYAIDENGKTVENVPAVDALYRPNQQMSYTQFFDSLMTGIKTQPEIYILVWRREGRQLFKGGEITRDNIGGYTFLQGVSKINTQGVITYQVTNAKGEIENYSTKEVIVLSDSRNPANINVGYSPLKAVKKWITVDDYIVAYQQGYFRNGAVPTGRFIITASTAQEFKDIVKRMQERHRGAGQNNNVIYTHRPTDATGKPVDAQVQWVPFSVANKDMELGVLTENVQKRKESVYGVPGVIRGVDDSANYATAQVMERSFVMNKLDPSTHNIWSTWTHELNRIVGGLGVAITYDLEIPAVADAEKVHAETKTLEANLIRTLTLEGYSLNSVVEAFELPTTYKNLSKSNQTPKIGNDKPQVDEGDEVQNSPDNSEHIKGAAKSTNPKATKQVSEPDRVIYERQLSEVVRRHTLKQIENAVNDTKAVGDATETELEQFTDDMLRVLVTVLIAQGTIEYAAGLQLLSQAGVSLPSGNFVLNPETREWYRNYLKKVGLSYQADTAKSIREVLALSNSDGWTRAQTVRELRGVMGTEFTRYRVERLATTEINHTLQRSGLEAMKQIQGEAGVSVRKVWNTSALDPCEYCASMNGTTVDLTTSFVPLNGTVTGTDGGIFVNDFISRQESTLHPFCRCYLTYEVVR